MSIERRAFRGLFHVGGSSPPRPDWAPPSAAPGRLPDTRISLARHWRAKLRFYGAIYCAYGLRVLRVAALV
jgi:hypothetical protein